MVFKGKAVFGRSPIGPFKELMEHVQEGVTALTSLTKACADNNPERAASYDDVLRQVRSRAEEQRSEIRRSLPKVLYMSLPRSGLLMLLHAQMDVLRHASETAMLVNWKVPDLRPEASELLMPVLLSAASTVDQALCLIEEFDEIVEQGELGREEDITGEMLEQLEVCDAKTAEVAHGARVLLSTPGDGHADEDPAAQYCALRLIDELRALSAAGRAIGAAVDLLLPH